MSNAKKIIIIGAGASGIAAATKLISNGIQNVLILEAENRIGGRINTIPFGNGVLDIGAQWCHGQDGNVVYKMAKDKNLLSSSTFRYELFNFVRSNGETIPDAIAQKLSCLSGEIFDLECNQDERRAFNGSLGNFFAKQFDVALQSDEFRDIDVELKREAYEWFHRCAAMYVACDTWYDASCQNYDEYHQCSGDLLLNWKDKGYRTVLDLLQNKIPSGTTGVIDVESKVLFNKQVTKIMYNAKTTAPNRIKIQCFDGSTYFSDHLICTVSLGVLKKHHLSLFEPHLPSPKINSIEGLGFGTVDKVFVEFEQPFWSKDWLGVSLLWQSNELREIRKDPVNGEWLEHIMGFYPVDFQPNLLLGWVSGAAAPKMERVSDKDFKAGIQRVLNIFLKNQKASKVKNVLRSKWNSNPNFLGSYTYNSMKGDAIGASASQLAQPIFDIDSKPIIQFAGEATSTHHHSTVHGAIETGWLEAQRLIDLLRGKLSKL